MAAVWLAAPTLAQAQVKTYGVIPTTGDASVTILDLAGFPTAVNVGGTPHCSASTPDGSAAYVSLSMNYVAKVNPVDGSVLSYINFGNQLECIRISPNGSKAYVTDAVDNVVYPINLSNDSVGAAIAVGAQPRGLAFTPDGVYLYVANTQSNSVSVIATATDTVATTIPVGTSPQGVIVTPDGTKAFVTNTDDATLSVIDIATNTVTSTVTLGPTITNPVALDVAPNGSVVYVADIAGGPLTSVDVSTLNVSFLPGVGASQSGVAFSPDGASAWVLDATSNIAFHIDVNGFFADYYISTGATPFAGAPFIGPQLLTGNDAIGGDGDLTLQGFGPSFLDFNGGLLQADLGWVTSRTLSFLASGGTIDNGSDITLNGNTVGSGPLFKAGSGRMIFGGTAGHATTFVQAGTLEVNGTHTPAIIVYSGGTLSGTGLVGNAAVNTGGTIQPGTASGTGILTGNQITLSNGSTASFRLNGATAGTGYDELAGLSGVALNDATLSVTLGYTPTTGASFMIVKSASGTFNGLADGATLTVGGKKFRITYHGGSGSDVVLFLDEAPVLSTINNITHPASDPPISSLTVFTATDDLDVPTVTAVSSNQALVPNSSLHVSPGCALRTLTWMPNAHVGGTTTITVTATDGGGNTTQTSFTFTITDNAPILVPIPDQTIHIDRVLGPLTLYVGDDLTDAASMGITATSSNPALLTNNNILITGGSTRRLSAVPATHAQGQTTITVTATDGSGQSAQQSFVLSVTDGPPTIVGLSNRTIAGGSTLGPVNFILSDDVTPVDALTVSATSSNSALLPNADIVLGGSGAMRTLMATPVFGASGSTQITVSVSDGTNTTTATFTMTVTNTPVYFLAEGATSSFFDTDILIANPNNAPALVTLTFYKSNGSTIVDQRMLPATSRTTIHAKDISGLEAASFATSVASNNNLPLVVERTMTWDASGYGSSGEKASSGAASTWYFAEGSQGYFHTYFLLLNPHPAANVAHVAYLLDDGSTVNRDYALAATSRTTVDLATEDALANRSFGATITFDLPGMAERAMYFGDSPVYSGGHDSAGVNAPATSWFLAEGATGSFFDTFVLVANPLDNPANVTMTYLPASGAPVSKQHTLAPHQRLTVNIATEDPSLASAAVATSVASDNPVIVERSQYWPQGNWYEAHNSAGETSAGTKWGLAEGRVGGTNHAQTYVLIANAGAQAADVTATFLRTDGTTIVKTLTIAAMSRVNIAVAGAGSDVPELVDEAFGTVIEATQPVIVERSMYTDANGVTWAAGTNATASRLQ